MLPQDEIVVATTASAHLPAAAIETITELVQRAKLDPLPTAPAGLVSRESVPTLIERIDLRFKSGNSIQADRAHVRTEEWERIRALLSAPAIGVSDAMVERALDAYVDEIADRTHIQPAYIPALRAALIAALRPTGEDR